MRENRARSLHILHKGTGVLVCSPHEHFVELAYALRSPERMPTLLVGSRWQQESMGWMLGESMKELNTTRQTVQTLSERLKILRRR